MKKRETRQEASDEPAFVEGEDFYFEDGLMVLTAKFLKERGYCCHSGCRHCPYPKDGEDYSRNSSSSL